MRVKLLYCVLDRRLTFKTTINNPYIETVF